MAVGSRVDERGAGTTGPSRVSLRHGVVQAGPLAVAGVLANGGSLLVTVVLARVLTSHSYGTLNQLLGVFFVVSTPGSALLVAVVRRLASWQAADGNTAAWARGLHRRAAWALAACVVALAAGGSSLASLLGRHDPAGLDAIALAGAVWVALCIDRGLLQARREYRKLSVNLLTEGALRTAFMVVAGAAGLGVTGVAVGVLVAELGTAVQVRLMAVRPWRDVGAWREAGASRDSSGWRRPWARTRWRRLQRGVAGHGLGDGLLSRGDVIAAVVALAAIALLQNIDVIVMGKEGPRQAGAYAAVSVSSKVLVFLALVVGGYLLPEAAHAWRDGAHALRQLSVSLLLVEVPGLILAGIAVLVPRWFLTVFFSARYVAAAQAFLPLAGAMVCLSAVVLLTMYLLAVGDRRIAALLVVAAAAATAAVALAHGSPRTTAVADLAVQGALGALAVAELVVVHHGPAGWGRRTRARGDRGSA